MKMIGTDEFAMMRQLVIELLSDNRYSDEHGFDDDVVDKIVRYMLRHDFDPRRFANAVCHTFHAESARNFAGIKSLCYTGLDAMYDMLYEEGGKGGSRSTEDRAGRS